MSYVCRAIGFGVFCHQSEKLWSKLHQHFLHVNVSRGETLGLAEVSPDCGSTMGNVHASFCRLKPTFFSPR